MIRMRVADVAESLLRILLQASPQHAHDRRGHRRRQRLPVRLALDHRGNRVRDGGPPKRHAPSASRRARSRTPRCRCACRPPCRAPARGSCRPPSDQHAIPGFVRHDRRRVRRSARVGRARRPEVQHLHDLRRELDVRGLEVAMDDAALVRRVERVGDLPRDRERLGDRQRPARDRSGERVVHSSRTSAARPASSRP